MKKIIITILALSITSNCLSSMIHEYAADGNIERIKKELKHINLKDADGFTPLHHIFLTGRPDKKTVEFLLKNGADPNIPNNQKDSILSTAILFKSSPEIIKLLLKYKANPNLNNSLKDIFSIYEEYDKQDAIEIIKLLIENGAIVDKNILKSAKKKGGIKLKRNMQNWASAAKHKYKSEDITTRVKYLLELET